MLHYLLDTDICIYLLNGHPRVKTRVSQEGIEALAIAIPTVGELYFGAYNSTRVEANVERVRAFLSPPGPQVLMIDEPAAEQFGRYKALLRREGRPIGDIDLFIAGVASHNGLTVVTNNTAHFDRLPDLTLENWLDRSSGFPSRANGARIPDIGAYSPLIHVVVFLDAAPRRKLSSQASQIAQRKQ